MEFTASLFSRLSPSPSPPPKITPNMKVNPPTVKGSPNVISEYIYNDIQMVKQEIKSLNEKTKIFQFSPLYYKIFKLIESNQSKELNSLKSKYEYNYTREYYKSLVGLYKTFLSELDDFLKILSNNYHNGLVKNSIADENTKSGNRSRANSVNKSRNDSANSTLTMEDAPEELIDPLTFEMFNDPVITPSGITYERSIIVDHLQRNGQFDPLTREPLHPNQLYPNLIVKNSVNHFINQVNSIPPEPNSLEPALQLDK